MSKNKSFTLIELLVVIVIIGILAGVIVISTSSSIDKANFAKAQAFSNTVQNELLLNLVSEWTFDEPQVGNITKDSWGTNHGTVVGATQVDDCVYGKCYSFDGFFTNYIQIGAITSLATGASFILSSWVYPEHTGGYRSIMGYDSHHRLLIHPDERVLSQQGTTNFYSATKSVLNEKWTHIIYWCNGLEERWYINGALSGSPQAMSVAEWNADFMLGQYDLLNYPYKGKIDEVRIYNDVFSAQQIRREYLLGLKSLFNNGNIAQEEYVSRISNLSKSD